MGVFIGFGIVVLLVMAALNKLADWGQQHREEQMKLGRGVQNLFVILIILGALFLWAAGSNH